MHSAGQRPLGRLITYLLLVVVAAMYVLPLLWMVGVSLKPDAELTESNSIPSNPQLDSYAQVVRSESFDYLLYARNTLIILVLSLVGTVLSSAVAAYGFARIQFRGRNLLFGICLATMMIPFPVIMVPQYIIFQKLGWIGTFLPLWVPAWFGAAFNIFLLRQFFMGIPRDLEESAMLDGCSRWGCFWQISSTAMRMRDLR